MKGEKRVTRRERNSTERKEGRDKAYRGKGNRETACGGKEDMEIAYRGKELI